MPKLKTRKSAAKRFKATGSGEYRRNRANARHILTKKSRKRKRRLNKDAAVSPADRGRIKASLPYAKKAH
jgi:large subunit ribosomal protein L35